MRCKRCLPLSRMLPAYSRYFGFSSGPNISDFITSEKPRMALSGVRSSWLMVARKRDLALLAVSARRRASSETDFCSSSSAISASFSVRYSSIDSEVERRPRARNRK